MDVVLMHVVVWRGGWLQVDHTLEDASSGLWCVWRIRAMLSPAHSAVMDRPVSASSLEIRCKLI